MKYIETTLQNQKALIENVWKMKNESKVYSPVAFKYIIQNIQHQCNLNGNSLVDVSPLETFKMLENTLTRLDNIKYCNGPSWKNWSAHSSG